jgi:hypothetical protein
VARGAAARARLGAGRSAARRRRDARSPGAAPRGAPASSSTPLPRAEALADADGASNRWLRLRTPASRSSPAIRTARSTCPTPTGSAIACARFDAIGLAFAGVPGLPHFGHNASVAWSITHGMADDQDLFVRLGRPSSRRYRGGASASRARRRASRDRDRRAPHGRSCWAAAAPPASPGLADAGARPDLRRAAPMLEARDVPR